MADTWRPDFADTPPFAHLQPWSERITSSGWPSLDALNELV